MPQRQTAASRMAIAALATLAMPLVACGVTETAATPTPDPGGIRLIRDLAIAPGAELDVVEVDDETVLVLVDRGEQQDVMSATWNGSRWTRAASASGSLFAPDGDLAVRRVAITRREGFPRDALLLVGRTPPGAIEQIRITIDGERRTAHVGDGPFILVFPAEADVDDHFETIDAGTYVLGRGVIEDAELGP